MTKILRGPLIATSAAVALAVATGGIPASASFPGHNGKIAYSKAKQDEFVSNIFALKPSGHSTRRLTNSGNAFAPSFSPDGSRIVYEHGCDLFTMAPDGSHERELLRRGCPFSPSYSAGGGRIAFDTVSLKPPFKQSIHVMGSDGTEARTVLRGSNTNGYAEAEFSPTANMLVLERSRLPKHSNTTISEIFTFDLESGRLERLTNDRVSVSNDSPSWSPDGRTIVWSRSTELEASILVMKTDGTHKQKLSGRGFRFVAEEDPVFSPNGKRIAFAGGDFPGGDPNTDIWVMKRNGTHMRRLTSGRADEFEPAWQSLVP